MLISEIFYSIQGEGMLTGVPSVFIRTSGCNLRCNWCDTPYASWNPEGTARTIEQIVAEVQSHPARHVVLTGGEPMIAKDIAALADAKFDGLVINAGAFTHTSVALRDALLGAHLPTVEVHISNIYKREGFRHTSLTAPACVAVITGLGLEGYHAAVRFLVKS